MRVAAIQMNSGSDVAANLDLAGRLLAEAAADGRSQAGAVHREPGEREVWRVGRRGARPGERNRLRPEAHVSVRRELDGAGAAVEPSVDRPVAEPE